MAKIPLFNDSQLTAVCKAIGHTEEGLKGAEIYEILHGLAIADVEGKVTKWKRLYGALRHRQEQDGCGNLIAAFIQKAMDRLGGLRGMWLSKTAGLR